MYYGFSGSLLFGAIGYAYKPDTRYVYRLFDALGCFGEDSVGYWIV